MFHVHFFLSYEMLWLWFNAYFKSVKIWVLRFIRLLPSDMCGDVLSRNAKCVHGCWCVQGTQVDAMKGKKRLFDVWSKVHGVAMRKKLFKRVFQMLFSSFFGKVSIECSNKSHTFLYILCCGRPSLAMCLSHSRNIQWNGIFHGNSFVLPSFSINSLWFRSRYRNNA